LLDAAHFKQAYPTRKWSLTLHELLCFPALLAGLIGGPVLARAWCEGAPGYTCGAWLAVSFWNLFNGLFELIPSSTPVTGW